MSVVYASDRRRMVALMSKRISTAVFADLAAEGSAPEWVMLFPAGPRVDARDGRTFFNTDPEAVASGFAENMGPLAIDYEHGQAHLAPTGQVAPAAGWIVAMEVRGGAIWGRVEWTERGGALIAAREYRFLSPEFTHDQQGNVLRIVGAGLVNRPALVMTALSREQEETDMDLKALAKALGLSEDTSAEAVLAAAGALRSAMVAICGHLKVDTGSDGAAVIAAIDGRSGTTALASVNAELATVTGKLKAAETKLTAIQDERHAEKIEAALDKAQAEGKITPASRQGYKDLCQAEGGLDRFTALAATLPKIAEPSSLGGQPAPAGAPDADPAELAALARKYQGEQAEKGITVSITEAVNHVKEAK